MYQQLRQFNWIEQLAAKENINKQILLYAAVPQLDRGLGYEPRRCRFKSCQPHQ